MRTAEEIVEQLELRRTCLTHDEGGHCLSCEFNLELADAIEALAKERDALAEQVRQLQFQCGWKQGELVGEEHLHVETEKELEELRDRVGHLEVIKTAKDCSVKILTHENDQLREWKRRAVETVKAAAIEMAYLVEQVNARPGGSVDRACNELAALLKEAETTDAKPTDL